MKAPRIEVHIEELVLHGFSPIHGQAIGAAVTAEVERLLAEQGLPPAVAAGVVIGRIDGGSFHASQQAAPGAMGVGVAQALFGGLPR